MKLNSENIALVLKACSEALEKERLAESDVEDFLGNASDMMRDYYALVGDDTNFIWHVEKKFGRVELYLGFPGKRIDPFEEGDGAQKRSIWRKVKTISTEVGTLIGYVYADGRNNVTFRAASKCESNNILKQPMIQAVLLGLIMGLLCGQLPEDVSSFIVDDLAAPVLSTVTGIFAGIMGPVIFLSLVTSISSLGDIDTLCDLGTKVFIRFLKIATTVTAFSLAIAVFMFPILGADSLSLDVSQIINLLISIIPPTWCSPSWTTTCPSCWSSASVWVRRCSSSAVRSPSSPTGSPTSRPG